MTVTAARGGQSQVRAGCPANGCGCRRRPQALPLEARPLVHVRMRGTKPVTGEGVLPPGGLDVDAFHDSREVCDVTVVECVTENLLQPQVVPVAGLPHQ